MSEVVAQDGNGNEQSGYGNYYYSSHQGDSLRGAVGSYDQGSGCNNWVPPALAPATNNMAAVGGHGKEGGVHRSVLRASIFLSKFFLSPFFV